jgi:CubicO group peptidase (beta-lactamase class C family)
MKFTKSMVCLFLVGICTITTTFAQSLEQRIDALVTAEYPSDEPGATVLVAKNGKVLYRSAFGKANLELDVAMVPENVFQIGSITKQFTAVAILMLEEQGKLAVTDKLSKYITDYPKGDQVTIHQLLNHTSGIKSYTGVASFMEMVRTDMTPIELIGKFKDLAYDFEPGEEWAYNNSAYIILGYIIEEVSGMSYEEFVEEKLFKPTGMTHSLYGSLSEIIPYRASGYQPQGDGFKNADYLSLTLPYAAGSIMSTVDDLLKWEQAIHTNALISAASKKKAFTPGNLNSGKGLDYGYGWFAGKIQGLETIEHGGGIFGYTTMGVYVPSEDVYVAVLTNRDGMSPSDLAVKITAEAIGKSYAVNPVTLSTSQLEKWVGSYAFEDESIRFISLDNGALHSQRKGSDKLPLIPISENEFSFEDGLVSILFGSKNGKRTAYFKDRNRSLKGAESDIAAPAPRVEVQLSPEKLKEYEGTFEIQPGFSIVVIAKGKQLFGMATGQPEVELFAENEDQFFLKVVDAQLAFERVDGQIVSVTLYQGGGAMKGMKK